ncbi:MAG: hypothetical protein H0S79_16755 [Anaerolineaceae bacterium]|nr:hypothetical protein [Anaerolineaceae bacterium]
MADLPQRPPIAIDINKGAGKDTFSRTERRYDAVPGKGKAAGQGLDIIQTLGLVTVTEDVGPIMPVDRTDGYAANSKKYW